MADESSVIGKQTSPVEDPLASPLEPPSAAVVPSDPELAPALLDASLEPVEVASVLVPGVEVIVVESPPAVAELSVLEPSDVDVDPPPSPQAIAANKKTWHDRYLKVMA